MNSNLHRANADSISRSAQLLAILAKVILLMCSLGFVLTTACGIYLNYSVVPVWDMWNGYLEFYYRSLLEGWQPWWEQHNEHRLVLAKIFFWIDVHFFRANLIFLFVLNFVFSALAFVTLFLVSKRLSRFDSGWILYPAMFVLVVFCFSWLQQENYVWAFQSQFHMAYLLPLWSFLALSKASEQGTWTWFLCALMLGVLSAVTMANGVLALPVMVVAGLLLGLRRNYMLLLMVVTLVTLWLYFVNFEPVPFHPSMRDGLLNHPYESLLYFARYLSGPFYPLAAEHAGFACLTGGLFLAVCFYLLVRAWPLYRRRHHDWPAVLALLVFLVFLGGTALSTSLSRAALGTEVPSRYMTPSLLGWSSLFILVLYFHRTRLLQALVLCCVLLPTLYLLLPLQADALRKTDRAHKHRIAALAVAMGVRDSQYLGLIYWDQQRLFKIAELARAGQKSIFSLNYTLDMPAIHPSALGHGAQACSFYIDQAFVLLEHQEYQRVQGWSYAPGAEQVPYRLVFSQHERVLGYAVSGEQRPDVAQALSAPAAQFSGFSGYLASEIDAGLPIQVYGFDQHNQLLCSTVFQQP